MASDSEKSPDAFRTISEVAGDLDVPQHVLRFWETRFSQIKPMKRGGGRRYYRPNDVDLLKGIRKLLYGEGFTIRGVQRILRENGITHVAEIGRGDIEVTAMSADEIEAIQEAKRETPTADGPSEEMPQRTVIHRQDGPAKQSAEEPASTESRLDPALSTAPSTEVSTEASTEAPIEAPVASTTAQQKTHDPIAAPALPAPVVLAGLKSEQVEGLKLAIADIQAAKRALANALK